MWPLGIEPDQIVSQLLVELIRILEELEVPVNKFLLDCSIETFTMGIHLRRSRIGVPMRDGCIIKLGLKGLHELGSIVCQYLFNLVRKGLKDGFENMRRLF